MTRDSGSCGRLVARWLEMPCNFGCSYHPNSSAIEVKELVQIVSRSESHVYETCYNIPEIRFAVVYLELCFLVDVLVELQRVATYSNVHTVLKPLVCHSWF